jgi:hypothetical protein
MKKPKVITNCDASRFADPDQRIAEISSDVAGGLLSMYVHEGRLVVELYHLDDNVDVSVEHAQVIRVTRKAGET